MYLLGSRNLSSSEKQSKFIFDRISLVEKHFSEIYYGLSAYTRKAARIRDKGDELAKNFQTYATSEKINKSLSQGLLNFSRALSLLSDHRDTQVIRLDTKVIKELGNYDSICRNAKEELKFTINARNKEISKKRNLDKILEKKPTNRHQINVAESELSKCTMEVMRSIKNLEKQTETFEKQKLRDIKTILLDFIQTEMSLHAKALEILTTAYHNISNIDEQLDFQEFQMVNHALDREFCRSMKIQTCELPNTGLLKTNSSTKNMQRPRTSYSTNDLLFAQAMKNKEDENRIRQERTKSMESIMLNRPASEGIPKADFDYELNYEESEEDSSEQLPSLYNYN